MPAYTVVVADDHPLYREAVAAAVRAGAELRLVGEATSGLAALELIAQLQPDVAVLDARMPAMSGPDVAAAVARRGLRTRIVLLSAHRQPPGLASGGAEGTVAGFLTKDASAATIRAAVLAAARGGRVVGASRAAPGRGGLTTRELEVLTLTADGASAPEIARTLHLSPETVRSHLRNVYAKLGVTDRAAAVAEAMRQGLLD